MTFRLKFVISFFLEFVSSLLIIFAVGTTVVSKRQINEIRVARTCRVGNNWIQLMRFIQCSNVKISIVASGYTYIRDIRVHVYINDLNYSTGSLKPIWIEYQLKRIFAWYTQYRHWKTYAHTFLKRIRVRLLYFTYVYTIILTFCIIHTRSHTYIFILYIILLLLKKVVPALAAVAPPSATTVESKQSPFLFFSKRFNRDMGVVQLLINETLKRKCTYNMYKYIIYIYVYIFL